MQNHIERGLKLISENLENGIIIHIFMQALYTTFKLLITMMKYISLIIASLSRQEHLGYHVKKYHTMPSQVKEQCKILFQSDDGQLTIGDDPIIY
jgi:hypothetical protein